MRREAMQVLPEESHGTLVLWEHGAERIDEPDRLRRSRLELAYGKRVDHLDEALFEIAVRVDALARIRIGLLGRKRAEDDRFCLASRRIAVDLRECEPLVRDEDIGTRN